MPVGPGVAPAVAWKKEVSESLAIVDSLYKASTLYFSDPLAFVDSVETTRTTVKELTEALVFIDSVETTHAAIRYVTDSLVISDYLNTTWAGVRERTESLTFVDSISKQPNLTFSDSISFVDSKWYNIIKYPTTFLAFTDSLDKTSAFSRELTELLSFVDSIVKDTTISPTESLSITDSIVKSIVLYVVQLLAIADHVTPELVATHSKTLTETLRIIDSIKDFPELIDKLINFATLMGDDVADSFDVDNKVLKDDVVKDDDFS